MIMLKIIKRFIAFWLMMIVTIVCAFIAILFLIPFLGQEKAFDWLINVTWEPFEKWME